MIVPRSARVGPAFTTERIGVDGPADSRPLPDQVADREGSVAETGRRTNGKDPTSIEALANGGASLLAIDGGPFKLIYVDPPWQYRDKANAGRRGACHKYTVMTLDEISALPVSRIAAPDCLLAMWHVPPMPAEALRVVAAWGFRFKTMKGFTWVKRTKHGKVHFGMGNWTRANAEDCLFAVRGKPFRASAGVSSLIEAPVREHSRKPDEVRERLVRLVGDVPRIELFARQRIPGWQAWGNELP